MGRRWNFSIGEGLLTALFAWKSQLVKQQVSGSVLSDASQDVLISRLLMRCLQMNLHFDDRITDYLRR